MGVRSAMQKYQMVCELELFHVIILSVGTALVNGIRKTIVVRSAESRFQVLTFGTCVFKYEIEFF